MKYHVSLAFIGGFLLGALLAVAYSRRHPESRECLKAMAIVQIEQGNVGVKTAAPPVVTSAAPRSETSAGTTRLPEATELETIRLVTYPPSMGNKTSSCEFAYAVYVENCVYARAAAVAFKRMLTQKSDLCVDFVVLVQEGVELRGNFWRRPGIVVRQVKGYKSLGGDPSWRDSMHKLHIFGPQLYDWKRVVYFDCDTHVRKRPDELFAVVFSGDLHVAAPMAYWANEGQKFITSSVVVFEPSASLWSAIEEAYTLNMHNDVNADLLNRIWEGQFTIIDTIYAANTGDLEDWHSKFFNRTLTSSPLVRFMSDALQKPWLASRLAVQKFVRKSASSPKGKVFLERIFHSFKKQYHAMLHTCKQ